MDKPKTLGEMLDEDVAANLDDEQAGTIMHWLNAHNIADCTPVRAQKISVRWDAEVAVIGKVEDRRADYGAAAIIVSHIELGDADHTRVPLYPGRTVVLIAEDGKRPPDTSSDV